MNLRKIWERITRRKPEPTPDPPVTPEDQVVAERQAELLREHYDKRDEPPTERV